LKFGAAVRAIAKDVSNELKFLDRWHEQALDSDVLRAQIANMIARIVWTLRTGRDMKRPTMDFWRVDPEFKAGLEFRTDTTQCHVLVTPS
jgi:hypothetical protein